MSIFIVIDGEIISTDQCVKVCNLSLTGFNPGLVELSPIYRSPIGNGTSKISGNLVIAFNLNRITRNLTDLSIALGGVHSCFRDPVLYRHTPCTIMSSLTWQQIFLPRPLYHIYKVFCPVGPLLPVLQIAVWLFCGLLLSKDIWDRICSFFLTTNTTKVPSNHS